MINFIKHKANKHFSKRYLNISDNLKTYREAEKEEIIESEVNHNFEADMYLEKLEQDNEKVSCCQSLSITPFNSYNKIAFVRLISHLLYFFFLQKMERSDSNDILGTYFRPRRAAELIHQNKVLNFWKDYSKKNNRTSYNNWMTPTALANNNLSNPSSATWQPIPTSAAFKTIRNGNVIEPQRRTLDDVINKPYYGVRPTSNVHLNNNILTPNPSNNMYKPLNYLHYFNETGDRALHSLRKPITPAPFLRENLT